MVTTLRQEGVMNHCDAAVSKTTLKRGQRLNFGLSIQKLDLVQHRTVLFIAKQSVPTGAALEVHNL